MDFALTDNQESIRDAVATLCRDFDDAYWLNKDREGGFPFEFHKAMADAGWLGVCIPEGYGGSGLGITEAAIIMRTISESGAGMSGASSIHMNIFGLNPVVVFGNDEQRRRMLPPMAEGKQKSCFAVTEPNTGLNTTQLKLRAERKGDRYVVNGQKVWISTAQVADKMLLLARTTPLEEIRNPTNGLSRRSPVRAAGDGHGGHAEAAGHVRAHAGLLREAGGAGLRGGAGVAGSSGDIEESGG